MGFVVGVYRPEQAEIVGHARQVGHQIRDHHARIAARANRNGRRQRQVLIHADRDLIAVDGRADLLAMFLGDQRFGIKQVELRRTSLNEEENHSLGTWSEVRWASRERARGRPSEAAHHALERQAAEAARGGSQQCPGDRQGPQKKEAVMANLDEK